MADMREILLARVLVVLKTVQGLETCERNLDDLSDLRLPAAILFDGDEEAFDNPRARGQAPNAVEMHPVIEVHFPEAPENVGTQINAIRARIQKALCADTTIRTLCGNVPHAGIRYIGMTSDLAAGRATVAKRILSFGINYLFKPTDL